MVPSVYSLNPTAPLTLRLFIYRCPSEQSCEGREELFHEWDNVGTELSFSIVGKRLLGIGSSIQDFGAPRTVVVTAIPSGEMRVIDLPLGSDGLGAPGVSAGDFLAYEMDTVTSDAVYRLLGAEIFSSETASLVNATLLP
jgi:hypothetical protein